MKKTFFCLCIVLLALVLISCGGKKDGDAKVSKEDISSAISKIVEKTESAVVSEIVEKAESVASSVANKIEEVVPSKTFTKKDVLDDFGEPTGNFSYDSKAFRGTYKTKEQSGNASLYISIGNNKKVSFKVVEDGNTRHFVGAYYTTDKFTIVIREENGNDVSLEDESLKQDENKHYNTFVSSNWFLPLVRNNAVKLVIKNDNATYNFNSIDTSELEGLLLDKVPYDEAVALMEKGEYKEAMDVFEKYRTDFIDSYNFYALEKHRECEVAFWKEKGSAGGYVFFDCDADNESGNQDGLKSSECGWRYLEAAPTDILDSDGKAKKFYEADLKMGNFGTKTDFGEGKNNTKILNERVNKGLRNNAVKSCVAYEFGGYKDWFIPSINELNVLLGILTDNKNFMKKAADSNWLSKIPSTKAKLDFVSSLVDGYEHYLSSSEVRHGDGYCSWFASVWDGRFIDVYDLAESDYYVRPIRAF